MLQPGDPGFMEAMLRDPTMGAAPPNLLRQLKEDNRERFAKDEDEPEPKSPPSRGGFTRTGGFATGNPMYNPMNVAGMAGMMGAQQGNALQNMINQTTNAWQDEHDSRVSQNREMRRMEHEKDIERMRIEAMLQRLQAEQASGPRPKVSGPGFAIY